MAGSTPDQIAADWAARLGASREKITRGVQGVTTAPGQAAARQKSAWVQNTSAAADKWAARTQAVSLGDWQQAMTTKGIDRIGQGATAAQGDFAQFMGQLLPHIDSVRATLPARGNLDANIGRATAFMRGMAKFQRR